jgi:hypothetical protein
MKVALAFQFSKNNRRQISDSNNIAQTAYPIQPLFSAFFKAFSGSFTGRPTAMRKHSAASQLTRPPKATSVNLPHPASASQHDPTSFLKTKKPSPILD